VSRREEINARALADGWHVDFRCVCEEPRPAIIGGDGYWLPPLMCLGCHCYIGQNREATEGPYAPKEATGHGIRASLLRKGGTF